MSLFRLTINPPDIMKDNSLPGDRALAVFISQKSYIYSTYNYGILDLTDDDDMSPEHEFEYGNNKGDWTFFYYAYSFHTKKAFLYLRYYDSEDSFT